eukprot:364204-Chlamydomonas_euryale.AAC.9
MSMSKGSSGCVPTRPHGDVSSPLRAGLSNYWRRCSRTTRWWRRPTALSASPAARALRAASRSSQASSSPARVCRSAAGTK